MGYDVNVNEHHFILSHAGIHKGYVDAVFGKKSVDENNVVDMFNMAFLYEDAKVLNTLSMYDKYRGWGGTKYGSLIWADAHSWFDGSEDGSAYGYQIFGHTQLQHGCGGLIAKHIACLDSAEPFVITNNGEIKPYNKL